MIINLNGWPGVGKLTTAHALSKLVKGRVLDNHTILNVGSAIAPEASPEFYGIVRAVRTVAFQAILKLPSNVPVILTNVVARGGTSGFLEENWQSVVALANARNCDLFSVTLTCSTPEHARRIATPGRELLGKVQDVELLTKLIQTRTLFADGAAFHVEIDNSHLSPIETAYRIQRWIRDMGATV